MPKEVSFNIKGNSNIASLVKELQNLKDAAAAVNNISGGGTGGGAGASPRGMMPKMNLWDKSLRDAQKYQNRELNKLTKPTGTGGGGGGGLMGALGMGAVMGAASGGTMLLVSALKDTLKESQIGNAFLKTLSKLFSVLIDLVLLPFLPILIWAMMRLVNAILAFSTWWQSNAQKVPSDTNPDGTKKTPLNLVGDWLKWINDLAKAWVDGMKNIILQVALAIGELGAMIIKFLWDVGWEIGTILADAAKEALKTITILWQTYVVDPITKTLADIRAWIDVNIRDPFLKTLTDINTWWKTNVEDPFNATLANIKTWIKTYIEDPWNAFLAAFSWDALLISFKSFVNSVIDYLNAAVAGLPFGVGVVIPKIPYLAEGGTIAQTGVAVVHKGETVVPAGQSGGNTFNFPNYVGSKSDLIKMVNDAMRQQGARYMA